MDDNFGDDFFSELEGTSDNMQFNNQPFLPQDYMYYNSLGQAVPMG